MNSYPRLSSGTSSIMYVPLLLKNWSIWLGLCSFPWSSVFVQPGSTLKPSCFYIEGFDLIFIYEGLPSPIFNPPSHFLWNMASSVKHNLLWSHTAGIYNRISELFTLSRRTIVLISLVLFLLFVTFFIVFLIVLFRAFLLPCCTLSLKFWIFYILSLSSLFIWFHCQQILELAH